MTIDSNFYSKQCLSSKLIYRSLFASALRRVIGLHTTASLPSVPSDNRKMGYGTIQLQKTAFLFDLLDNINPADVVESENPLSMESVGQVVNFIILSIYFSNLCFVAILNELKPLAT